MGADDDATCVEHVWELDEVNLSLRGAETAWRCTRCQAVSYSAPASSDPTRPKL